MAKPECRWNCPDQWSQGSEWPASIAIPPRARPRSCSWRRHSRRATIEQDFHDVKEVWGSGRQQVRNIWNNPAVYNLNLWMHALVELWSWNKSHEELCDRGDSPWDDAERRPSHANRRKALCEHIFRNELSTITDAWSLPPKIIQLVKSLRALAA